MDTAIYPSSDTGVATKNPGRFNSVDSLSRIVSLGLFLTKPFIVVQVYSIL